jgi:hypothetical protein
MGILNWENPYPIQMDPDDSAGHDLLVVSQRPDLTPVHPGEGKQPPMPRRCEPRTP